MDPLQVKPHEAAGWTGAIITLTAFLTRLFKVRRATTDSPEVRELRAQLKAMEERNREQQLQLMLQPITKQLADVLRENGRQQGELDLAKKDIRAIADKCRELERRLNLVVAR